MARKPRLYYPGGLYHIICRGNNGAYIFEKDKNKLKYLKIIQRYKKRYGFKLYAYVIMSNHVHMLMEQENVSLSKIMQCIQQVYTQYYNKKYQQSGHVFEQRYKAIHCDKDTYLLTLIRYIHQNPIRANIKSGLNYPWSSHHSYIKGAQEEFVDTAFPLSIFSSDVKSAIKQYIYFMNAVEPIELANLPEFQKCVGQKQTKKQRDIKINETLEQISSIVSCETKVKIAELKSKTKRRIVSRARKILVWIIHNYTEISQRQVAKYLNRSDSSISRLITSCYEEQPKDVLDCAEQIAKKCCRCADK